MKKLLLLLVLSFFVFSLLTSEDVIRVKLPEQDVVELVPYSTFDFEKINESSAIVKSRVHEDLYWTLNDSGAKNRIFPINRQGEIYRAEWYKENQGGIYVGDAVNVDWEEMTVDNNGNLYIGACGNNSNARRDLAIYVLRDPLPIATGTTRYFQKINFHYPQQIAFPPEKLNYDSEAQFWANGKLYLLTKHRSDTNTRLYRFDEIDLLKDNPLTLLKTFDIQGSVTAADATINGKKLAILTYNNVWVFEVETGDDYFNGKIKWLPISAKQCEAICFDDDETLIITNEQTELFELKLDQLITIN